MGVSRRVKTCAKISGCPTIHEVGLYTRLYYINDNIYADLKKKTI